MDFSEIRIKIQRYCARKERCESQIRKKLKTYEASENDIERILKELKHYNFWNEQRFAASYVHDKHKFNSWGPFKIRNALSGLQVNETLIDKAMSSISYEEFEETLHRLLVKKYKINSYENEIIARKKLSAYAQNKGYSYDMINAVLGELLPG